MLQSAWRTKASTKATSLKRRSVRTRFPPHFVGSVSHERDVVVLIIFLLSELLDTPKHL